MNYYGKRVLVCISVLVSCLMAAPSVFAETVLEKIERTGEITVGYREGGVPFGYINDKGEWGGFDMDLGDILVQRIEEKLGKKIRYNKTPINPKTRIALVANRTVDIVMGATTITMAREEVVDFSLPYFLTGTKVLVPKGSAIRSFEDLAGKRVGAGNGCAPHIKALNKGIADKRINPACEIVLFEDHLKGFLGLQQGKVDAYFTDESMLVGMVAKSRNPADWEIVGDFVTYEPYGFILPKDDSDWRDFVNATLISLIKSGEFVKIHEKWFGPKGAVPYPMSEEYKNMLNVLSFPD